MCNYNFDLCLIFKKSKFLLFLSIFLLFSCIGNFYQSTKPVEKDRFALYIGSGNFFIETINSNYILIPQIITNTNIIYSSNLLLVSNTVINTYLHTIFNLGLRYGLNNNMDVGIRIWNYGAIIDTKWMFLENPTFRAAFDFEFGYCGTWEVGFMYIHDVIIFPWLTYYFNFKWRYYFTNYINDNEIYDATFRRINGIMFSPNMGIVLFTDKNYNLLFEAGVIKVWDERIYTPIFGLSFIWKFL